MLPLLPTSETTLPVKTLVAELEKREIPYLRGWVAQKAHGSPLKNVSLTTLQGTFDKKFECDLLVASAGMTPVTGPLSLAQAEMAFDQHTGFFLPRSLPVGVYAAGRLLGLNDSQAIEASGRVAGLSAAASCGKGSEAALNDARQTLAGRPQPEKGCNLVMAPVKGRKAFICFDEDTTVKNIKQAIAMGFDATELIKRFTAAGTGPGQSGIPGHNLPLLVAQHHTDHGALTRPTTMRAPLVPTLDGHLRGDQPPHEQTDAHARPPETGWRHHAQNWRLEPGPVFFR